MSGTDAQAIEYDHWFREQIKMAMAEADDPKTAFVPHDKFRSQWKAKKQEHSGCGR